MNCNSKQKNLIIQYTILLLLFAGLIISIVLLSAVPPISRDALTHHLFVPKLYVGHGGIYEIPSIPFSYYPMNLDLLYMIPLYLGNNIIPKYIHFLFALLTGWLIYSYIKNRISKVYGLFGALFFLSIPIIVKLSITVYVDLGLMFFTTASLLLLFRWLDSSHKIRYLVFAGICCGLAVGTKYNGLIALFLLPLFVPILYIRSRNTAHGSSAKGVGYSILFVLAALLAFSPWLVRNYIWTGNPIYPLHNSLFQQLSKQDIGQEPSDQNSPAAIAKKLTSRSSGIFASRKMLYHETWWQTLLLPIRFFFEGQDDNPRYFDGKLSPFLLFLPLFAFIRKSPTPSLHREKITLLSFALLFFFFTFFQQVLRIRYIVPILPMLTLLSMFGIHNIFSAVSKTNSLWKQRGAKLFILILLGAMLSYNGLYLSKQFQVTQPLSYLRGQVSKEEYITRFRPEYPVIQYANNLLPRDTRVLCLFLGNRGYYMNFDPVFDNPFQEGLLSSHLASPAQGRNIKSELLRQDITHILLRSDLSQKWLSHLEKEDKETVTLFFRQDTKKLFSSGGYSFYLIKK